MLGDIGDARVVERACDGCDAVVHLAAYVHRVPRTDEDREDLRRDIVDGSACVATHARRNGAQLVVASTVAVYGSSACEVTEATPPFPDTPYGIAKLEAERVVGAVDAKATLLRIALVYGPHDRGNVITLTRAIDRGLCVVVGGGHNRKSIIFADNLAGRIASLLEARDPISGVWIAADDYAPTQRELVDALAHALGRRSPPSLPLAPMTWLGASIDLVGRAARRPPRWRDRVLKLAAPSVFAGNALDARLGYRADATFEEAIHRTVSW